MRQVQFILYPSRMDSGRIVTNVFLGAFLSIVFLGCQSGGYAPSDAGTGNGSGSSDESPALFSHIKMTVFLGGPMQPDFRSMGTLLRNYLPTTDPYGMGASSPQIRDLYGVVDWIKVELRDTAAPHAIKHQFAGLLLEDGRIADTDGQSLPKTKVEGTFMVLIKHRTHMPIRMAQSITLALNTVAEGDYSKLGAYYELPSFPPQQVVCVGSCADNIGIVPGQTNKDCELNNTDYTTILAQRSSGATGYQSGDLNLDGVVDNRDENSFFPWGRSSINNDALCTY